MPSRVRGVAGVVVALAVALSACTPTSSDDSAAGAGGTEATGTTPTEATATTEAVDQSLGPVVAPFRRAATARPIYFVMPDRFENGEPDNDTGGVEGGPLQTGFLPENRAYHHGGDLVGLTERLPYLADLGVGAIWITPPFTNRFVQGNGTVEGSSSSYHGYWQIDWTKVDPHLGSEAQMVAFIEAAHALDIAVYFDIVINHTGDVIQYGDDSYVYYSTSAKPYLDADGEPFDLADLLDTGSFPELDATVSFPHQPVFATPEDASAKAPDWLNDVTLYHNRGNSTFQGESSLLGDFFGLDDLFTEHPAVVSGMIDLYADVIDRYGVDGFRIDTMKHVDIEFWEQFAPAITDHAAEAGRSEFFFFGEVFSEDPILLSSYTDVGVPGTLDFLTAAALQRYVADGSPGSFLAQAFDNDDWFTDLDSNASTQVTFFGNHDMGRMGYQIAAANPSAGEEDLLARMELGFDLLFTVRGVPAVYYGDEQGFVGDGGDQLARQSMFPSAVPEYMDDDNIGTDATPADDNFDPGHPLYQRIAGLSDLRTEYPAFVTGAQIVHDVDGPLFAFSRIDRVERIEHLVVANNATLAVPARFEALTPNTTFTAIDGSGVTATSDAAGELLVEMPPLSVLILRADAVLEPPEQEPEVAFVRPEEGIAIPTLRYRLEADLTDRRYAEVTFAVSIDGAEPLVIGTDDAAPYRVYWNTGAVPDGAEVQLIATVDDGSGRLRSATRAVTMGVRG